MQSKMDNQAKNRDGNTPPPNTITFTPNSEDPIGTQTQTEGVIVEPTPQPTNPTPCDLPRGHVLKPGTVPSYKTKFRINKSKFRITKSKFRVNKSKFRVNKSKFRVNKSKFRVNKSKFRVTRSKFLVTISKFRVNISKFRVNMLKFRVT